MVVSQLWSQLHIQERLWPVPSGCREVVSPAPQVALRPRLWKIPYRSVTGVRKPGGLRSHSWTVAHCTCTSSASLCGSSHTRHRAGSAHLRSQLSRKMPLCSIRMLCGMVALDPPQSSRVSAPKGRCRMGSCRCLFGTKKRTKNSSCEGYQEQINAKPGYPSMSVRGLKTSSEVGLAPPRGRADPRVMLVPDLCGGQGVAGLDHQ